MEPMTMMALAAALQAGGSLAGSLGSESGGYDIMPPALGWNNRRAYKDQLALQMWKLASGQGGFGADFISNAWQSNLSNMAPLMSRATQSLNQDLTRRGINDSGVAARQQGMLQSGFMTGLSRNLLDITLKNEMQRRLEALQGMQMLMGGITPGGTVETQGGTTTGGVMGQGILGGMGDAFTMYGLGSKLFGGGGGNGGGGNRSEWGGTSFGGYPQSMPSLVQPTGSNAGVNWQQPYGNWPTVWSG